MKKIKENQNSQDDKNASCELVAKPASAPLHCLRKVRCREAVSRETIAEHLGIDVDTVELIENESTDIPLCLLHEWKKLLNVPIGELLVDTEGAFNAPEKIPAQLTALMRTAITLTRQNRQASVAHMAHNLINQLLEIMPELRQVVNQYGPRQTHPIHEYGLEFEDNFLDEMISNCGD
ncbi:MAG: helix-turn-helix transcriptional regulator [Pirellulales bacterium]|nr:helix-turn-helix transcriptional regulator [Pirellulales bacterium]